MLFSEGCKGNDSDQLYTVLTAVICWEGYLATCYWMSARGPSCRVSVRAWALTGMVTEKSLPVAAYWHHKSVLYIVFIYISLQRNDIKYLLPFSTSQIALEKLFGLGCCPWIRDRHRYYSCVYILDEIERNYHTLWWFECGKEEVILYSSAVQLGFLKANMCASRLKTQNDCPKWIYIHIGD